MRPLLSDTLSVLLPTEEETLLLRACLCAEETGRRAWNEWLENVGNPMDELSHHRPILSHFLPLLHVATRRYGGEVPPGLAILLRAAYFQEELRGRSYRDILQAVLRTLEEATVDATVLKGAALAGPVYGDWALRHCHDIEFLVDDAQLESASRALQEAGVEELGGAPRAPRGARLVHRSGLPIELHTNLFPLSFYRVGLSAMMKRRQVREIAGWSAHVLSSSDSLLHVCGHASCSKSRATLRWAADTHFLAANAPDLDWDALLVGATETKLALPLSVFLTYLAERLDAEIPPSVVQLLARDAKRVGRTAREAALFGARERPDRFRAATSSWKSRVFLLRWRLLPTPSYLHWTYGAGSRKDVSVLYLKRIARHVARAARRLSSCARPVSGGVPMSIVQSKTPRPPWEPTDRQALLVKAALSEGELAIEAWERWKSTVGIESLDAGSQALLPIVYRNLVGHGVGGPEMRRARLAYETAWLVNERLFRDVSVLLEALRAAGIETMILKGAALALLHYRDLGLRSLGDVDVLVRPSDVRRAVDVLTGLGWEPARRPLPDLTDAYLRRRRAINLSSDRIKKLDLHWHVIDESCRPNGDDGFWSGAIRAAVRGVETRAMNPTDQLLHVCAHEIRWSPVPLPRWIVDVAMILRSSPESFEGNRLASYARELDLALPVREALQQALPFVESPIVSSLLEAVHGVPSSRGAIREFRRRSSPPDPLSSIATEFWRMSLQPGRRSVVRRVLALPAHARAVWGLTHAWQLPLAGVRWGTRLLVRIVRYLGERRTTQGSTGNSDGRSSSFQKPTDSARP